MKTNNQKILEAILEESRAELAPTLSPSEHFEHFVADLVLRDHDLSLDEVASGLVDGGNDGGIDAIYSIINDELLSEDTGLDSVRKGTIDFVLYLMQMKVSGSF